MEQLYLNLKLDQQKHRLGHRLWVLYLNFEKRTVWLSYWVWVFRSVMKFSSSHGCKKPTEHHIHEVRAERDFNVVTNEHQLGRRERSRWQLPQPIRVFRSYLLSVRKNKSTLSQANYNSLTMSLSRESQCCPSTFGLSYHIRSIPGMRRGVSRHLSHRWQVVVP